MSNYDVSVIVATYNPDWEKLLFTIKSVMRQSGVSVEIIICDDGSKNEFGHELETFFHTAKFDSYQMVFHDKNQGTVKNVYDGIKIARGYYTKLISPGDAFLYNKALSDWITSLKRSGKKWSICEIVNYYKEDNCYISTMQKTRPQCVNYYNTGKDDVCKWLYCGLRDIAVGCSAIVETSLQNRFMSYILDKVKYAEDITFCLMLFMGEVPYYHCTETILYEYGTGISTSGNNAWEKRIQTDFLAISKLLVEIENNPDKLQKKIINIVKARDSNDRLKVLANKYSTLSGFIYFVRFTFWPRMTKKIDIDVSWLD